MGQFGQDLLFVSLADCMRPELNIRMIAKDPTRKGTESQCCVALTQQSLYSAFKYFFIPDAACKISETNLC